MNQHPQPEKHMGTLCGFMLGGGGMLSYRCNRPLGHTEVPAADPEPHYAPESPGSVVLWEAWHHRQQASKDTPSPEVTEASVGTRITCPTCEEPTLELMGDSESGPTEGRCRNPECGDVLHVASAKGGGTTEDPDAIVGESYQTWKVLSEVDPTVAEEMRERVGQATEALRTREGDQRLPDGDESAEDDQSLIIKDFEERRFLGIQRYRQGHRPFNGRDTLLDLYEEQLDLLVYLKSIHRMGQASREQLIAEVGRAIEHEFISGGEHDTRTFLGSMVAEVAVDRIMGWVVAQQIDAKTLRPVEEVEREVQDEEFLTNEVAVEDIADPWSKEGCPNRSCTLLTWPMSDQGVAYCRHCEVEQSTCPSGHCLICGTDAKES